MIRLINIVARLFVFSLCVLFLYQPSWSQKVEYFIYKTTPQAELTIYVHYPPNWNANDSNPAIVFFFGGGWYSGTPDQFLPQAEYFASRGMVTARADYRVKNRHKTTPEKCVEDGKSAIRWMRKNANLLGIDPNRIVASGGSAGGHVAACTFLADEFDAADEDVTISSKPNLLLLFNPVLNLMEFDLAERTESKDNAKKISPLQLLSSSTPPTMLFYGTQDKYFKQGQSFEEKCNEFEVPIDLFIAQNAAHGFFNNPPWLKHTIISADKFLAKYGYLSGEPTLSLEPDPTPTIQPSPTPKPNINTETGKFHATFDERNPYTKDKEMTQRTGIRMGVGPVRGYFYDLDQESFEVYIPPAYDGSEKYGLMVWISASQSGDIPDQYIPLMDKYKMIWVGANRSGNKEAVWERRVSLALDAVYNMQNSFNIERNRTYVGGVSGGGRVSSGVAFLYSDLFAGGLFVIGANHWKSLRLIDENLIFKAGYPVPPNDMMRIAERKGRYVLLTGENDFNRNQMETIFQKSYGKQLNFSLYIEVPEMGHRMPEANWFETAIQFLDDPMPFRNTYTDSIRDGRKVR